MLPGSIALYSNSFDGPRHTARTAHDTIRFLQDNRFNASFPLNQISNSLIEMCVANLTHEQRSALSLSHTLVTAMRVTTS